MEREVKTKAKKSKREYEKPKVVYERKLEALGGACADSTYVDACMTTGCPVCGLNS